jgi:hypothetical protein
MVSNDKTIKLWITFQYILNLSIITKDTISDVFVLQLLIFELVLLESNYIEVY